MIIQPYIENSIHHGVMNTKNEKGMISLDIATGSKLIFTIDDNGEGIKSSNHIWQDEENHRSMGGAITEKRIEMYNRLHDEKIELEVLDKSEAGNTETGTRVIIKFPLNN